MAKPSFSVVHLTMRKGKNKLSVGSGVLYKRGNDFYIATAWHNISGRNSYSLKLLSKHAVAPDNVVASVAVVFPGVGATRIGFTIPIESANGTHYLVHPKGWPRVDVAVIPINPDAIHNSEGVLPDGTELVLEMPMQGQALQGASPSEIQPIQNCLGSFGNVSVPLESIVSPGDESFVLGYPRGISDYTMEPIWKRATIASDLAVGWNGEEKFLIDCASREGMSGAPVIAYSKTGRLQVGAITYVGGAPSSTALLGIYVGRIIDPDTKAEDRLFEASIGTVWKVSVIDQIIDGQVNGLHSDSLVATNVEIKDAIAKVWPDKEGHHKNVLAHWTYLNGMVNATLGELNGRANPDLVAESVKEYARSFEQPVSPHH